MVFKWGLESKIYWWINYELGGLIIAKILKLENFKISYNWLMKEIKWKLKYVIT